MAEETRKSDYSIKSRWGDDLHAVSRWRNASVRLGGFVPVVRSFLRLYSSYSPHGMRLTATDAMLILHILDSKWDEGAPRVKTAVLAKRLGISAQQVKKYLRDFKNFDIDARYNAKTREYEFDFDQFFQGLAKYAEKKRQDKDFGLEVKAEVK